MTTTAVAVPLTASLPPREGVDAQLRKGSEQLEDTTGPILGCTADGARRGSVGGGGTERPRAKSRSLPEPPVYQWRALGASGEDLQTGGRSHRPTGGVGRCEIGSDRQPLSFRPPRRSVASREMVAGTAASSDVGGGLPGVRGIAFPLRSEALRGMAPIPRLWSEGNVEASRRSVSWPVNRRLADQGLVGSPNPVGTQGGCQ